MRATAGGPARVVSLAAASQCAAAVRRIPGWFRAADFLVFDCLLAEQDAAGVAGHLLEIGAFHGRSAVVLALHANGDEVHIIDPWEDRADHPASRSDFLANYGRATDSPAHIHQARSVDVEPAELPAMRFIHVDGSHRLADVLSDLRLSSRLLTPGGVVAVDDFRSNGHLDVAAATWDVVNSGALSPLAVTPEKIYLAASADAATRAGIALAVALRRRWGTVVGLTGFRQSPVVRVPPCDWGDLGSDT